MLLLFSSNGIEYNSPIKLEDLEVTSINNRCTDLKMKCNRNIFNVSCKNKSPSLDEGIHVLPDENIFISLNSVENDKK